MDELERAIQQLLGRASGPMHIRLFIQPVVAIVLAIRAGLRDARENRPAYLWDFFMNPAERRRLIDSGWKDIGRVMIAAFVIDALYQLIVFRSFYPLQALICAFVLALLPYILLRGPVTRLSRGFKAPAEVHREK
jgi:hypothetical protein